MISTDTTLYSNIYFSTKKNLKAYKETETGKYCLFKGNK